MNLECAPKCLLKINSRKFDIYIIRKFEDPMYVVRGRVCRKGGNMNKGLRTERNSVIKIVDCCKILAAIPLAGAQNGADRLRRTLELRIFYEWSNWGRCGDGAVSVAAP